MRQEIKMKLLKDSSHGNKGAEITMFSDAQADYLESNSIATRVSESAQAPAEADQPGDVEIENETGEAEVPEILPPKPQSVQNKKTRSKKS